MNRRVLLKQMAVAAAGALLLPSCVADPKKATVALNNLNITGEEEELLANLASTLIPKTDTPGAREVDAHLFTLIMVDDCMAKPEQETYLTGLRDFDKATKTLSGKSFSRATPSERTDILKTLEEQKESLPDEIRTFYFTTRQFIIQGYTSSQHFLTDVKPYQLIPGPNFKGCAPVTPQPA